MNEEEYVSFEVARLLREKGFNELCRYTTYIENNEEMIDVLDITSTPLPNSMLPKEIYTLPTLYQAQKWLREVHNTHITVGNSASGYWWELSKANNGTFIADYNYSGPNDGGKWDTYEDALSFGILEALKRI